MASSRRLEPGFPRRLFASPAEDAGAGEKVEDKGEADGSEEAGAEESSEDAGAGEAEAAEEAEARL